MRSNSLIVFDLDDTLLDYYHEEIAASNYIFTYINSMFGVNYDVVEQNYNYSKDITRKSKKPGLKERFRILCLSLNLDLANIEILYDLYVKQRVENSIAYEGIREIIKQYDDMKIIIATNGDDYLQRLRIHKVFINQSWKVYTSVQLGFQKPERNFFDTISDIEGVPINNWIVFGDSYERDLAYPHYKGACCNLIRKGVIVEKW